MKEVRQKLTHQDEVIRKLEIEKGQVVRFVIQYTTLVDGHWRKVVRYDNMHGSAHMHIQRYDGSERKIMITGTDFNALFTELLEDVTNNYEKYRRQFMLTKER